MIINLAFYFKTKSFIYKNVDDIPTTQVVIIPGAAILKSGELSPIFKDRVDKAIELYNLKKVSKILVSGDNSTVSYNEVNPVRIYLLERGIPDQDIFLDHAGFDTYSTMYRARDVFGATSTVISTQDFHLPRAVFIGKSLGLTAYGADADTLNILPRNYVREVFANVKAFLNLSFDRLPKYLGEPIPITGDGRIYP